VKWFLGNKVEIYSSYGVDCLKFIHPAYEEGFFEALDDSRLKKIFSEVLKELINDEDSDVRLKVGEAIFENIEKLPRDVQFLLKNLLYDRDPGVGENIAFGIEEYYHRFPSELKEEEWVQKSIDYVFEIEFVEITKGLRRRFGHKPQRVAIGAGMCEDCGNYFDNLTYIRGRCLCENCEDYSTPLNLIYRY
jgi:hypothetical protein